MEGSSAWWAQKNRAQRRGFLFRYRAALAAQAQALDQIGVTRLFFAFQVVQQFAALGDHFQKTAAAVPDLLEITAESDDGLIMGLRHRERDIEGVQFHPESVLTSAGHALITNFLDRCR